MKEDILTAPKKYIAFTICSNNYLAHAKTLGDSFLNYHPEFTFVIGLVDKINLEINPELFSEFKVISVEDINIPEFDNLAAKFNITELNTAAKPSYFHYIFKELKADAVVYLDPDIMVLSRFDELLETMEEKNIILTPHILTPIDDEFAPTDYHTLRGGVFNLGFIALANYEKVKMFLDWWHQRVVKYGFVNLKQSMFYDQIWMNYVPCFHDDYFILKHPGYNMANWNLHERRLTKDNSGKYFVNQTIPLRFFHFSNYHYDKPNVICAYQTRFDFINRPDLLKLFEKYQQLLLENEVEKISKIEVFYYPKTQKISVHEPSVVPLHTKMIVRLKKSLKLLITGNA